tara:strand:- start:902 stop:2881 length:1980 start_codon:yes stop_codon:yes gene_type:complete
MSTERRESEEELVDLTQVIQKLIREKLFVIVGAIAGAVLGVIYYVANPLYGAVSTLEIRPDTDEIFGKTLSSGDLAIAAIKEADMATAAAKLTRASFLTSVALHPDIVSCQNFILKGKVGKKFVAGKELTQEERTDVLMGWVGSKRIVVEPRQDMFLIDIIVEHPDARTSSIIANTFHKVALVEADATRGLETNYLIDELVSDYEELGKSVNLARSQLSLYDDARRLKEDILEARSEISILASEYKNKHPVMMAAMEKVVQLDEQIVREISKLGKQPSEQIYWKSVPGFQEAIDLAGLEKQAATAAEKLIPFLDARLSFLDAEFKTLAQTYDRVVSEAASVQIANDSASGNLKSFQLATFEGSRAGLSPVIILALGVILGTCVGVGVALLRAFVLRKGICNTLEWSQNFELPVVGELLELEGLQLNPWQLAGSTSEDASHYRQAETIRSIRAHITLMGRGSEKRRLLVTSALPEEGKTTLSTSLALSFARLKTPTLLVDLDLRKPSVHQVLGLPNEQGMTDLLLGRINGKDAIQELEGGTLHVITAGQLIAEAPELLSSGKLDAVLADLRTSYEWIIFDSAPFLSVSDTKLIAPYADYTLLTVRANRTELPSIETTLKGLNESGTQTAGAVINFVHTSDVKSAQSSYAYGYGYGLTSVQ